MLNLKQNKKVTIMKTNKSRSQRLQIALEITRQLLHTYPLLKTSCFNQLDNPPIDKKRYHHPLPDDVIKTTDLVVHGLRRSYSLDLINATNIRFLIYLIFLNDQIDGRLTTIHNLFSRLISKKMLDEVMQNKDKISNQYFSLIHATQVFFKEHEWSIIIEQLKQFKSRFNHVKPETVPDLPQRHIPWYEQDWGYPFCENDESNGNEIASGIVVKI